MVTKHKNSYFFHDKFKPQ